MPIEAQNLDKPPQNLHQLQHNFQTFKSMVLGMIATGQTRKALSLAKQAADKFPGSPEAINLLGMVCYRLGKHLDSANLFQRAMLLDGNNAEFHNNLGASLLELGKYEDAFASFDTALTINPDYPEPFSNIGLIHYHQGDYKKAITAFNKALKINEKFVEAWSNLGLSYKAIGDFKNAARAFEQATNLAPYSTQYLFDLAQSRPGTETDADHLIETITKYKDNELAKIPLLFSLGKVYDDCKQYDQAFAAYQEANRLKRKQVEFDVQQFEKHIKQIIKTFSPNYISRHNSSIQTDETPVFIIGMPRCGSSLLEQILASHSAVHGAGETGDLEQILLATLSKNKISTPFPECLAKLDADSLDIIANTYLEKLHSYSNKSQRIIDKTLFNFRYAGLIVQLFPKARIIHCRRNPIDTCLSIYTQHFNKGQHYAYNLDELCMVYQAYMAMMNHWRKVLGKTIFEIDYELLVNKNEQECKKLIKYLGLRWEASCLRYYETDRNVQTGSAWQVRQPIYHDAVNRWKNYQQFIGPLVEKFKEFSSVSK